MPSASLVQHVRAAVGAFDDVPLVGRQFCGRPRLLNASSGGQRLVEIADHRSRSDLVHAEERRREAATVIHDRSVSQCGDFQIGGGHSCRFFAHGEPLLGLEIVAQAHPIRVEPRSQGYLQKEHGLASAEVLWQHSTGNSHHRIVVVERQR